MDVGIGLPSAIPGTPGCRITAWAAAAESAGFSTLAAIDRVVFPNMDPVPTLAAAAAVTERIGLATTVLVAPYRGNGTLLAKQLATVDRIAGGRLTVGIGVGVREDDYQVTGSAFHERGRRFDQQLAAMRSVWMPESGGGARTIGPIPDRPGGLPLLLGGSVAATFRRMAEFGAGWIARCGDAATFAAGAERARRTWRDAGRDGEPRLVATAYACLGDDSADHAGRYLGDYNGATGDAPPGVASDVLTSSGSLGDALAAFEDAGCHELILLPCTADLLQVSLIADVAMA